MVNKLKRSLNIKNRVIHDYSDCFVIAEIGHNHQGSVEIAKQLFKAAKDCGVDAVKLQKRFNKKLYTREFYSTPYNSENAYGETYGLHREALEFGEKEYKELKKYADHLGIIFFATPFDFDSVDFLENIDLPLYKVASADIRNIPLIEYIAKKRKPMLISTGGATLEDVKRAYNAVLSHNKNFSILQCTASYPAEFSQLDLHVISEYQKEFPDIIIGFSAHDNGIAMAVAAYVLGARIIEKHFTLNRVMKGTDHAFSLEPLGMKKLVRDLRRVKVALGDRKKKIYESEKIPIMKMSKKIVASRDLKKGHIITQKDIAFKSPGGGLHPYQMKEIKGKRLKVSLKEDDAITLKQIYK